MRTDHNRIRIVKIEKVIDESPTVRTLVFKDKDSEDAKAGQFLMVWIPGIDELPMSIMIADNAAALTVRKHGPSSTLLYNMQQDSLIGVRGPYGNPFRVVKGDLILIGGGTGLVPLMRLCKMLLDLDDVNVTMIMGARTRSEVIFEERARDIIKKMDGRLIIATDDGSYGRKGLATDLFAELLRRERFDMVYTCGPERMMKKVIEMAEENGIESQASLERIMKCGIGLCGSCSIGPYLVCKDGPVMEGKKVLELEEFGMYARDKSGRLSSI